MAAIGAVEEAGTIPKKVAVDFEAEEVPSRGPGGEEPRETRRLGVLRSEGAIVVATPADSWRDRTRRLCVIATCNNKHFGGKYFETM